MNREHLMRHLWCRVMLDSGAPAGGFTPERGVVFVAQMLGASPIEVGLCVGGDFLTGTRPLPTREILERDAAHFSTSFPSVLKGE